MSEANRDNRIRKVLNINVGINQDTDEIVIDAWCASYNAEDLASILLTISPTIKNVFVKDDAPTQASPNDGSVPF